MREIPRSKPGMTRLRQQNKKSPKVLPAKFSFAIFAVLKVSMAWTGSISFYRYGLNLKRGGKI